MHSSLESSSSSQGATAILTPDSDSDDSGDFGNNDQRQASIKLLSRNTEKLSEKSDVAVPEAGELGRRYEDAEVEEAAFGSGRYDRRSSAETSRSYQLYTPDEERAVVRKFDRRLVAFVAFLYMLSFLDRSSM